jgi:ADP-ribose pyrophosphatase YjhB (NUDIX family)
LKDLFDKNFQIIRSAGGIVVRNITRKIILVNNKRNTWTFPKGHIERNESALMAAKREIFEETGLKELQLIGDLGNYERIKRMHNQDIDFSKMKKIQLFLFKTNQQELNPIDPDIQKAVWINKDEVVNVLTYNQDKTFFLKIIHLI